MADIALSAGWSSARLEHTNRLGALWQWKASEFGVFFCLTISRCIAIVCRLPGLASAGIALQLLSLWDVMRIDGS